MKYKVIIRPEAENDLKETFSWYEDKRVGTRKYLIKRFPYKVIYLVAEERIIVLAISHGKRNPKVIKKRINGI